MKIGETKRKERWRWEGKGGERRKGIVRLKRGKER